MSDRIKITIIKGKKTKTVEYPLDQYLELKQSGQPSVIDSTVNSMLEQMKQ